MRKNWVTGVLGIAAVAAIGFLGSGWGNDTQTASSSASTEKVVKMGVTQGLHAEIMEEVKKEAAKQGISMEIVEFSDFVTPDVALDNGEIDMNSIQHQPFLDNVVWLNGIGKSFNHRINFFWYSGWKTCGSGRRKIFSFAGDNTKKSKTRQKNPVAFLCVRNERIKAENFLCWPCKSLPDSQVSKVLWASRR